MLNTSSSYPIPRIFIAGLSGGSGKTFLSLGLSRAFSNQGFSVLPYKKGPDYIDSAWLKFATNKDCFCLDPFFLNASQLEQHFIETYSTFNGSQKQGLALIEGNRGLFDGKDLEGSCSSAHVAKILKCPVIVTINCTKSTRTIAAIVQGIANFDKDLQIAGVVLNQTGTKRHADLVRSCVEHYTDMPVLGTLPRMRENPIPERHMGLHRINPIEQNKVLDSLALFVQENIDMEKVYSIASNAKPYCTYEINNYVNSTDNCQKLNMNLMAEYSYPKELEEKLSTQVEISEKKPKIAYIYDDAFWFYYKENLLALEQHGAELCPISILDPKSWYEQSGRSSDEEFPFDALYIGGGFPELFAQQISQSAHLETLRSLAEKNMPIYAECGGFMLLSHALHIPKKEKAELQSEQDSLKKKKKDKSKEKKSNQDKKEKKKKTFPMANIFSINTKFYPRPQGLGYVEAQANTANPFHPLDLRWQGHEFHFSSIQSSDAQENFENLNFILELPNGTGMGIIEGKNLDGLLYKQTFASYTHLFAPCVPSWAKNFYLAAKAFQKKEKHRAK